jgi:CubicO group peptidase (beta-lactamase class C family)
MHTPQFAAELESGNERFQGWALGWMLGYGSIGSAWAPWLGLGEHARANTFSHGGFSSLHALGDPDRDLAVAVCLSDAPIDAEGNASDELAAEARVVIGDAFLAACGT